MKGARLLPVAVLVAASIGSIATEAPPVWYLQGDQDGSAVVLTTTAASLAQHVTVVFTDHQQPPSASFQVDWNACGDGAPLPMRAVLLRDQPDVGAAIERAALDCSTGTDTGELALPIFDLCTASDCVQGYTIVFERLATATSGAPLEIPSWSAHASAGGDGTGPYGATISVTIP